MRRRTDLFVIGAVLVVILLLGVGLLLLNGTSGLRGQDSIRNTNAPLLTGVALALTTSNTPGNSPTASGSTAIDATYATYSTLSLTEGTKAGLTKMAISPTRIPSATPTVTPSITETPNSSERLQTAVGEQLLIQQTLTGTAAFQATVISVVGQRLAGTATVLAGSNTAIFTPTATNTNTLLPSATATAQPLLATLVSQQLSTIQTQTAITHNQETVAAVVNQMLTVTAAALPSATITPTPATVIFTATPTALIPTLVSQRLAEAQTQTAVAKDRSAVEATVNQLFTLTSAAIPSATVTPTPATDAPSATPITRFTTLVSQRFAEVRTQTAVANDKASLDAAVNQVFTQTAAALPSVTPTATPELATQIKQYQAYINNQTATAAFVTTANSLLNLPLTQTTTAQIQQLTHNFEPLQTTNAKRLTALLSLNVQTKAVFGLSFNPTGTTVAAASDDNTVVLWDTQSGTVTSTLRGFSPRHGVAFSPDGETLAYGSTDGTVRLWNLATNTERATLNSHTGSIIALAFSRDGKWLAVGSSLNVITLWDAAHGSQVAILKGHLGAVLAVAFNADSTLLASSGQDGTIRLWDVRAELEITNLKFDTHDVTSIAFNADSNRLVSAHADGNIRIWDIASGKVLLVLKGHVGRATSVAYSRDGSFVAAGGTDKTIILWDTQTGVTLTTLRAQKDQINDLAFSPDGTRLASSSSDGSVQIWAVPAPN